MVALYVYLRINVWWRVSLQLLVFYVLSDIWRYENVNNSAAQCLNEILDSCDQFSHFTFNGGSKYFKLNIC